MRRRWMRAFGVGLAASLVAGCGGGDAGPSNGGVPPTSNGGTGGTPPASNGGRSAPNGAAPTPDPDTIGPIGTGVGTIAGKLESPYARLAESVVYIAEISGGRFAPPTSNPVMDQKNKIFTPHLLPVLGGTTVDFPNTDDVRHSVYAKDGPSKFNLGQYEAGVVKQERFDAVGVVHLGCNIHQEMSAYVVVCQNPHFVLVPREAKGAFEIPNVPAGRWRLTFFHEKIRPVAQVVTVTAGATTTVTFAGLERR